MHNFWTTGIKVEYGYRGNNEYGWSASIEFQDENFMEDNHIQGTLTTRYYVPILSDAIDEILMVMEQWNIRKEDDLGFTLCCDESIIKDNLVILQFMRNEAERRGWKYYF